MGQYFEDQVVAWFNGGREWYMKENGLTEKDMEYEVPEGMTETVPGIGAIRGDFDPYVFYAETEDQPL